MGLLNEIAEKLLKNFLSLKEDDWIEWIVQLNDWQDACDKHDDGKKELFESWGYTIWKLKPKGEIELVTPYSGHSY